MLLDNFIANMYGPLFLFLYFFWVVGCLIIFGLLAGKVGSHHREVLLSGNITEKEIAALYRGERGLRDFLIFNLLARNILVADGERLGATNLKQNPEQFAHQEAQLSFEAREIYDYFQTPRTIPATFDGVTQLYQTMEIRFLAQGLLKGAGHYQQLRLLRSSGLFFLLSLGMYKLTVALMKGHANVLFLIIMMVIGALLLLSIFQAHLKPRVQSDSLGRLTNYGKTQLSVISLNMRKISPGNIKKMKRRKDYNQLFLLMLFTGTATLPFLFPHIEMLFPAYVMAPPTGGGFNDGGGSSSNNGSDSDSGSSTDGGSSDSSGGGGCGSGCGGCGGD